MPLCPEVLVVTRSARWRQRPRVWVGDVVDLGLLANAAGAVILFVGTILAAGVIVLVAVKRTRPPTSTDEDARPLARV